MNCREDPVRIHRSGSLLAWRVRAPARRRSPPAPDFPLGTRALPAVTHGRSCAVATDVGEDADTRQAGDDPGRPTPHPALSRAVLDSLPAHVAVIDPEGRIVITNLAWQRFLAENGGLPGACDVGSNSLAACQCGDDPAARVAAGIEAVLGGEK